MTTTISILVNGEKQQIEVLRQERDAVTFSLEGRTFTVELANEISPKVTAQTNKTKKPKSPKLSLNQGEIHQVTAPIPGVVVDILVAEEESIETGATLLRLEAMKMENKVTSPIQGTIKQILIEVGQEVGDGQILLEIVAR